MYIYLYVYLSIYISIYIYIYWGGGPTRCIGPSGATASGSTGVGGVGEVHEHWVGGGGTWPLHDIVNTNIGWCMAYERGVEGVVYCAIVVQ